jgi:hypothetical protein
MTDTQAKPSVFDSIIPTFHAKLREKAPPPRPSDGSIAMAQKSYDGEPHDGEIWHAMSHRFPTVEMATLAADELKRAGFYTSPPSSVTAYQDKDDERIVRWSAGARRGRAAKS